MKFDIFWWT